MFNEHRNYKSFTPLSTLLPNRLPKGWPRSSLHVREGVGHHVLDLLIINNVNINNRENQDKHKHKE